MATPISNMTVTWTNSGTTFNAIKMNVTDTASNAASNLMDLQVGGASRFYVRKNGLLSNAPSGAEATFYLGIVGFTDNGSPAGVLGGTLGMSISGAANKGLVLSRDRNLVLSWNADGRSAVVSDCVLASDAADTLAQRRTTNAQTFRVYNTYTDASNYERLTIQGVGASGYKIIGESAGTGVSRSLQLDVTAGSGGILFATGGVSRFAIASSNGGGHFIASTDNTYDIGTSGALRPRYLYLGGGSLTGSQADSSVTISPTWNTTGTPTAILLNVTDTASNAASQVMDLQVGGISQFKVRKDGFVLVNSRQNLSNFVGFTGSTGLSTTLIFLSGTGTYGGSVRMTGTQLGIHTAGAFGFTTQANTTDSDVLLERDAADTLALRRTTNAQTFRVYNTYTDASNYERGVITWSSNQLQIGTESAGTGSARDLYLVSGTGNIRIGRSGGNANLLFFNDNAADIGASGANRPRNVYIAGTADLGSGNLSLASDVRLSRRSSGVLLLDNNGGTDFGRLQFGGTTSSFPALKRSSTTLQVRLADDSAFGPLEASTLTTSNAYTVATLPAAGVAGRRSYVTDATTPTFLGALTGGGAVICPVFDNGTAWVAG